MQGLRWIVRVTNGDSFEASRFEEYVKENPFYGEAISFSLVLIGAQGSSTRSMLKSLKCKKLAGVASYGRSQAPYGSSMCVTFKSYQTLGVEVGLELNSTTVKFTVSFVASEIPSQYLHRFPGKYHPFEEVTFPASGITEYTYSVNKSKFASLFDKVCMKLSIPDDVRKNVLSVVGRIRSVPVRSSLYFLTIETESKEVVDTSLGALKVADFFPETPCEGMPVALLSDVYLALAAAGEHVLPCAVPFHDTLQGQIQPSSGISVAVAPITMPTGS